MRVGGRTIAPDASSRHRVHPASTELLYELFFGRLGVGFLAGFASCSPKSSTGIGITGAARQDDSERRAGDQFLYAGVHRDTAVS
jgi:hypothetical protein